MVDDSEELIGFACFGVEARLAGLPELPGTLDVGVGMHPDHTGKGHGREFSEAVFAHGKDKAGARRFVPSFRTGTPAESAYC